MSTKVLDKAVLVDSARLLEKFPEMIKSPKGMVAEGLQNSMRAGATEARVTIEKNDENVVVSIRDNGRGCDDIWKVLTLSRTGWNKTIQEDQSPAGWGVYHFIAFATTVTLQSRFGKYVLDCARFLHDANYRNMVFDNDPVVFTNDPIDSFCVSATIPNKFAIDEWYNKHSFFDTMSVYVNDALLEKYMETERFCNEFVLLGAYEGNDVYFAPFKRSHYKDLSIVDFHGHVISTRFDADALVYVRVRTGNVVTPVLPYRESIKDDDLLKALQEWLTQKITNYYRDYIISVPMDTPEDELFGLDVRFSYLRDNYSDAFKGIFKTVICLYQTDLDSGSLSRRKLVDNTTVVSDAVKVLNPFTNCIERICVNDSDLYFAHPNTPDWVVFEKTVLVPDGDNNEDDSERSYDDYDHEVDYSVHVRLDHADDIRFLKEIHASAAGLFYNDGLAIGTTSRIDAVEYVLPCFFEKYVFSDDSDCDSYDTQESYYQDAINNFVASFKKPSFPEVSDLRWLLKKCEDNGMFSLSDVERTLLNNGSYSYVLNSANKTLTLSLNGVEKIIQF